MLYQLSYEATHWERGQFVEFMIEIWTQQIDLAHNVWLHSSVGRASHRYSQRSRVRIPLKPWYFFFFFQASSFQLLKLENLLRRSLFTLFFPYCNSSVIIDYSQPVYWRTWKKSERSERATRGVEGWDLWVRRTSLVLSRFYRPVQRWNENTWK